MNSIAPVHQIITLTNSPLQLLARHCLFFSIIALVCLAFPLIARAQYENTAYGTNALANVPNGSYNTAIGYLVLTHNRGLSNTGTGAEALLYNQTGSSNTATGDHALTANRSGARNTATGAEALVANNANDNTAMGHMALRNNSMGFFNTASGVAALFKNDNGSYNTATGARALNSNYNGGVNVANGYNALEANVGGFYNVASGAFALGTNTSGGFNTASGANALYNNNGNSNTATGHQALQNNTTGNNNVAVGFQAGNNLTSGSNNIAIGAGVLGKAGEANTTRIGKSTQAATYIGGIYNKTVASATGLAVRIDSTGKLGTVLSSARYKDDIKPMDKTSEAILALEPVTFLYKQDLDPDGVPQFGLIAEQVEKVNPDLIVRDEDGKVSTVRYEAVNAMLLNEFLQGTPQGRGTTEAGRTTAEHN